VKEVTKVADIVYESPKASVGIHWGRYISDGKVTDEGMPVITEAMQNFFKGVSSERPNYFIKKEKAQ
jgi:hypothetical protein